MTKKTGLQLYSHIKAGHIFLGTQASDQVGFLSLMISSRPSKELNTKLENLGEVIFPPHPSRKPIIIVFKLRSLFRL